MTNDDLARRVETMLAMLERRGSVPGTISLIRDLWAQREADRRLIASTNQALTRALERAEEAEDAAGAALDYTQGRISYDAFEKAVARYFNYLDDDRVVAADPAPTDTDYHPTHRAGECDTCDARRRPDDDNDRLIAEAAAEQLRRQTADPALDMPGPDTTEGSR